MASRRRGRLIQVNPDGHRGVATYALSGCPPWPLRLRQAHEGKMGCMEQQQKTDAQESAEALGNPQSADSLRSLPAGDGRDWHAIGADKVLEALDSTRDGLTEGQARARLAAHGPNALPRGRPRHPVVRFLSQCNNALIYFLLAAAVAAGVVGHAVDAVVIASVVLINALIGFVQEGKAEQALEAMQKMISPRAGVIRAGARRSVAAEEVVPGDIVLLDAGDRVPADMRLIRARGFRVDEALLTGESVPAEKKDGPAPAAADLGGRHSMAYSGTLAVGGQATGVAVATGRRSEIGRISEMLQSVEPLTTPLLRQINRFGRQFTWVVLAGSLLLFLLTVFVHRYDWVDALIAVVALAVAAIPEGLPAVITISLAIGVQRMAARNAVIRR